MSEQQCNLCASAATHGTPVIDQPWVDKLPVIRWLRKLYNAAPRFTVVVRGEPAFCELHFRLAEQLADNDVAERRYVQAQLNASEFFKVYKFNHQLVESAKEAERLVLAPFDGGRIVS